MAFGNLDRLIYTAVRLLYFLSPSTAVPPERWSQPKSGNRPLKQEYKEHKMTVDVFLLKHEADVTTITEPEVCITVLMKTGARKTQETKNKKAID